MARRTKQRTSSSEERTRIPAVSRAAVTSGEARRRRGSPLTTGRFARVTPHATQRDQTGQGRHAGRCRRALQNRSILHLKDPFYVAAHEDALAVEGRSAARRERRDKVVDGTQELVRL